MLLKNWSYSSLTQFENCARQYQKLRVTKEVIDEGSDATREGHRVHTAFELRVRDATPLPEDLSRHEHLADTLATFPGEVWTEVPLAVNKNLEAVDFKAPDAWCQGIIDVLLMKNRSAAILDYKTGKKKPDSEQLMLMAALVFANYESIHACDTSFLWLKVNDTTDARYTRDDQITIWMNFLPRVRRMEKAFEQNQWLPKPSGLCGWCACSKTHCEFAKK